MKWIKTTLGKIATSIQTGPFGSQLHQSDYSAIGTPVVMPKDIVNGTISETSIARVSDEHVNRLSRHKINAGDILYSRRGDVGRCAIANEREQNWLCGTGCLKVSIDNTLADSNFVFYSLQQAETIGWVVNHAVGSTMLNLNTSILEAIPITMPDLVTQQRIVSILSAYDELIAVNRRQIGLLEEAAARLYNEYFVRLHFPGYEHTELIDGLPAGWTACQLGDVIEFNPTVQLTKSRLKESIPMSALSTNSMSLDLNNISTTLSNSGAKFQNSDTLLARITPCLENGKTAFVANIESDEGAVGSTEFIVMRSKSLNPYMVYLLARTDAFRQYAINSMTGSDGRQRVQAEMLAVLPYQKPSDVIIELFGNQAKPIFDKISTLCKMNQLLAEARDRLLPRLLSGELDG